MLRSMDGVQEAVVIGEPNAITGQLVKAKIRLSTAETPREFRKRMLAFCRHKMARYKIPQRIVLVNEALHGERFKTIRR